MKIHLNNQTAELREYVEDPCVECPFMAPKYSGCPHYSETILNCYDKDWVITKLADIFTL